MKKYFIASMASLAFCTMAQANVTITDYEESLNEWQKTYPVISEIRKKPSFKKASKKWLNIFQNNKNVSSVSVFRAVIEDIIPEYINKTSHKKYGDTYSAYLEKLDPVYRDAFSMPPMTFTLPTTNNLNKVHYVIGKNNEEMNNKNMSNLEIVIKRAEENIIFSNKKLTKLLHTKEENEEFALNLPINYNHTNILREIKNKSFY